MATLARQPFAPLDGARLQTLTSLKNRQNAAPAATKRKASELADDDAENVDPLSAKRPKGSDAAFAPFSKDSLKPSLFLTPKPSRPISTPRPRARPHPPSKLNTSVPRAPLSAPAGRSPTRGKRAGVPRRRTGAFSRVDPPSFGGSGVPFSLDAALKGTIPSYSPRATTTTTTTTTDPAPAPASAPLLPETTPDMKSSWFFDIHEDTPDQELTNLLQHSTCILDISSDEETARRERGDRGKENVPPPDDVSQTTLHRRERAEGDMVVEKERFVLGEMAVGEFYGAGCDASSVFFVPGDEEDVKGKQAEVPDIEVSQHVEVAPEAEVTREAGTSKDVEALLPSESAPAAVLQPMEGTGESFVLWESGSSGGGDAPELVAAA